MIKGAEFVSDAGYAKRHSPHWMTDVEIDPNNPDRVWFVTGYGVWTTRNASAVDRGEQVRWSFDNHGLEECVILDLACPPSGEALLFSSMYDQDGFRHTSLESPPPAAYQRNWGGSNALDVAGLSGEIVVRQHGGGKRGSLSLDNGVTWAEFAAAPATPSKGQKPKRPAISADGKVLLWAQVDDVPYRSADHGATWTPVASLPRDSLVVADRVDPMLMFGYDGATGRFYQSRDAGASFTPAGELGKGATRIRTTHGMSGRIYAVVAGKIVRSTDGGTTFETIDSPLSVYTFGLGKSAPGSATPTLFANGKLDGTYGIYRSTDDGRTWTRINDDRNQFAHLHVIEGDPRQFGRVYLGSGSRGVIVGDTAAK
jgi:hypothetical protein